MSLPKFPPTNRTVETDQVSSAHKLSGCDSTRQPEYSPTDTLGIAGESQVATPKYIYYRIYAEDGAIPSKTSFTPGDAFIGRIKAGSVPPPLTAKTVKRCIAKSENIKDRGSTSLFPTSYSKSPMVDAEKITAIIDGTGPGTTPQEPLALVAKMSDPERSSDGRDGLASAAEPDTTNTGIRYVYYLLYADDSEMPSKVANDPEEPSLGRIRADCITPPHSPTSIKLCISRAERNPGIVNSDLFADRSCDTPLTEGHIAILRTDGPGQSPNKPMAIVQADVQVESSLPVKVTSIPDGRYLIKNRAANIYWAADRNPICMVYFWSTKIKTAEKETYAQWDITQDTDGNISMKSLYAPSSWVGAEIKGSSVPVPWRLIPTDSKSESYYLTTDISESRVSQNPRVPVVQRVNYDGLGTMATLKEGDQLQMWQFIRI